jgi:hypothetical protein
VAAWLGAEKVVASCDSSRMMFDEDRTSVPRAYVGLPDDDDKDLAAAIGWCLDQADGNARAVGVQIASKRDLEDVPQLAAFLKAGAKAYPNFRGKMPALPSGPVLLYRPFAVQLWEVETKRTPSAIAAYGITGPSSDGIGHTGVACQPWVTAFKPTHLGGPAISAKTPIVPDPVVAAALDTFTNHVNSSAGLVDPRDRSTVIDGLTKLKAAGHSFDPEDILAGALVRNWRGDHALELRNLAADLTAGRPKRYQKDRLVPHIVEYWRNEAATT